MKTRTTTILLLLAVTTTGCVTTFGSRTVPHARFDYSEAITRSWNEQMLLNLVRLRYRDTPQFLELSSVVTQYSIDGRASAGTTVQLDGGVDSVGLSGNVGYSERPTISYQPLQGQEFATRMLSPLPPEVVVLLSQAGWSVERLLLCCVHQINGVRNAPSAAGPTPDYVPRYETFQELARLMRSLQVRGSMQAMIRPAADDEGHRVVVRFPDDATEEARRLRTLLGLEPGRAEFDVTTSVMDRDSSELALVGRSLLSTMFFLSQSVEPPPEHEVLGKVTVTRDADENPFEWSRVVGPLLRIRSQRERPDDAFVTVRYRGHWFYIHDADLNSKTTFGLLHYLFSLHSTAGDRSPLLTLSAGG